MDDVLEIAGKRFRSRLMMGSGKFRTADEMRDAYAAAGAEIVTVAIRRLDLDDPSKKTLLDEIDWSRYTILPNTAGCYNVEDAMRDGAARPRADRLELGQARSDRRSEVPLARPDRHAGRGPPARQGRVRGAAVHHRRSDPGEAA